MDPRERHHHDRDECHEERAPATCHEPVATSRTARHGHHRGVLAGRLGHAEGGGDLLQEDDDGDADGEALDHGPRDVGQAPTEARERGDQDQHAGHAARPTSTDRRRSGPRSGTSTTVIAPVGPETCTFEPPKTAATRPATMAVMSPACGTEPGGDAERERQGQRHHARP